MVPKNEASAALAAAEVAEVVAEPQAKRTCTMKPQGTCIPVLLLSHLTAHALLNTLAGSTGVFQHFSQVAQFSQLLAPTPKHGA